jgi:RsiW-degrading membrane proteinase PrsW (M82 family)
VDARAIGFLCGIGFGVAEGILYSQRNYNGSEGAAIYAVRFLSLVGFHGLATATAAEIAARYRLPLSFDWRCFGRLVWIISPVMLLHAVYDTFCSRNESGWALLIVFMLFGIFTYQVESSRKRLRA